MGTLEDAKAALDDLRHGIPRRGEYPEYDREHDDIDKIDALIAEHERLAERLEEAYRIGADGWERATEHAAEAKRLTAELEQWKTTADIRREAYVAAREDLKRLTAPPATDNERCNHGECAWQDGCTLKGCPVVTTVAGDPWHGCSLPSGHSGDHDFSVRLYGSYPEFGITPPTDDEREALASGLLEAMLGTDDGGFIDSDSEIPAGEMYRLALGFMRSRLSSREGPITEEWEYGMSEVLADGSTAFGYPAPTRAEAEARVTETRRNYPWPEEIGLARRRKAGPWEPVEDAS